MRATLAQNLGRLDAVQRRYSREAFAMLNNLVAAKSMNSERGVPLVMEQLKTLAAAGGLPHSEGSAGYTDEHGQKVL